MPERLRVLIVDDEPMIVAGLRRLLARAHDVVGCTSVDDVLARLRRGERYDALVIDYQLGDCTAATLVDEVVRIAPELAARIAILSGDDRACVRASGRPLPCLAKPVEIDDLRSVVEALGCAATAQPTAAE